jgi:predicted nucleic acid-binding Zn ribbon protein
MIIFNELEYAEKLLKHGFVKFMSGIDLVVLAKYLRYLGKDDDQVKDDLNRFCAEFNPAYNEVFFYQKIQYVLKASKKYNLIIPSPIPITQKEIDIIKILRDYKAEKVLFILLVVAKHFKLNVGYKKYYAHIMRTEMFTLAKVHTTKEEKNAIIYKLDGQMGLIDNQIFLNRKDMTFLVNFIDEESEPVFYVDDFKNIVSFYPHYCSVCGKQIEKKSNVHEFCKECWKERERELWKENKRKIRKYDQNVQE